MQGSRRRAVASRISPPARLSAASARRTSRPSSRSTAFSRMQGRRHRQGPGRSGDLQILDTGLDPLHAADLSCAASRAAAQPPLTLLRSGDRPGRPRRPRCRRTQKWGISPRLTRRGRSNVQAGSNVPSAEPRLTLSVQICAVATGGQCGRRQDARLRGPGHARRLGHAGAPDEPARNRPLVGRVRDAARSRPPARLPQRRRWRAQQARARARRIEPPRLRGRARRARRWQPYTGSSTSISSCTRCPRPASSPPTRRGRSRGRPPDVRRG